MTARQPGYYWIKWSELADTDVARRRPSPLIGEWDGHVWWLSRSDVYRFDREIEAIAKVMEPPTQRFLQSA